MHSDGRLVFEPIEDDISKNDVKKIKIAIKEKNKNNKQLAKRLKE